MNAKAQNIQQMFASIAPNYDRANSWMSVGLHSRWRRAAARFLEPAPDAHILDACCGTGDFALALADELGPTGRITATDFVPEMIQLARAKTSDSRIEFREADLLSLPFQDNTFDAATVAFGIRNVVGPIAGLEELRRVVRPGGRILILEFGQPCGRLFAPFFRLWSRYVIPALGKLATGQRQPYEYLPETSAAFPAGDAFVDTLLVRAGLARTDVRPLTRGVAWMYRAHVTKEGGSV